MLKIAVISLAVVMMANAEPPPSHGGYIPGPGPNNNHHGGGGGYHGGGGGGGGGYYAAPSQQQPYKVRPAGPSKIFGWLGSKLPKIPNFLPRFPHFPKYKPNNLPNYQAVIFPQPPKGLYGYKPQPAPEKVQIVGPSYVSHNHGQNYYSAPAPAPAVVNYQPVAQQQQFRPQAVEPNVEVMQSQLLSYEKEIVSGNPNQNYYQPSPVSSPPLYAGGGGKDQIPVVPQSNGPDYFNTAYTGNGQQYQTQYTQVEPQQQYTIQNVEDNYGASFGNIEVQQPSQSQGSPQIYDASIDLRGVGGPLIESQQQTQQEQSYMDGSALAGQDSSLSSIISSLTDSTGHQNTAYSQHQSISVQQPQQYQNQQDQSGQQSQQSSVRVTSPYSRVGSGGREIVPGVKLMSQGNMADGNPVFEVVADANAPTFNGHPFDINKLISMIEPGAQLESAPELSEASSESKETYVEAPSQQQQQQQQQQQDSGTSDLHFSESDPLPFITNLNGTRISAMPSSLMPSDDNDDYIIMDESNENVSNNSNDNSSSSLMDIMEFFQQTHGKGYVIVEKKGSNLTLTNDTTDLTVDLDDELTQGPSLLNITSETIPTLENQQNKNKFSLIDPTYPKKAGFSSINSKTNSSSSSTSFVKLPNSTYLNPTIPSKTSGIILPPTKSQQTIPAVVFPTRKSKPYVNIRPTPTNPPTKKTIANKRPNYTTTPKPSIISSTTKSPYHNYEATPSTTSKDLPLLGIIPGLPNSAPKINPILDTVVDDSGSDDDESTFDDLLETDGDLTISESKQVKSIAITVTPPTHLLKNMEDTTTPVSPTQSQKPETTIPLPVATQKSVSSKTSKSFPFPVYRKKTETTK